MSVPSISSPGISAPRDPDESDFPDLIDAADVGASPPEEQEQEKEQEPVIEAMSTAHEEQQEQEPVIEATPTAEEQPDQSQLPPIWQPPPPPAEHPEGDAIRRQVEFYFSDENLPSDEHLLEKCGNHDNLPVSIKSICGFKKMRRFKPYLQVVAALKKSAYLDVVEGNKIKRKVPLRAHTVLDDKADLAAEDSDLEGDEEEIKSEKTKIKKELDKEDKEKKPKEQPKKEKLTGYDKPTGFEEFYAEPPVTPDEFKEEVEMYDPGIEFRIRMETAIQRFKSRRKMFSHYTTVFDKLMRFGGVEAGQRQFTGGPKDPVLENHDAAQKALMLATHTIDDSRDDTTRWVVDFEAIAKGFLSSYYPYWVSNNLADLRTASTVMRSFYNYLLHHNVCPEYTSQVFAARAVCDLADTEHAVLETLIPALPGLFNIAASTLTNGYYADKYVEAGSWDDGAAARGETTMGTTPAEARIAFRTAIAACGSDAAFETAERALDSVKAVETLDNIGLVVTAIEPPSPDTVALYDQQNAQNPGKLALEPVGKIVCTVWDNSAFVERDGPAAVLRQLRRENKGRVFELWVERSVLEMCFLGLRLVACVRRLGGVDVWVVDQVVDVLPSFYVCLENELLDNWKEPRWYADEGEEELLQQQQQQQLTAGGKEGGGGRAGSGEGKLDLGTVTGFVDHRIQGPY